MRILTGPWSLANRPAAQLTAGRGRSRRSDALLRGRDLLEFDTAFETFAEPRDQLAKINALLAKNRIVVLPPSNDMRAETTLHLQIQLGDEAAAFLTLLAPACSGAR